MTAVFVLILWCVLVAVVGTMRTIILRAPDSGAKLTLRTVRVSLPMTGSPRGRRVV